VDNTAMNYWPVIAFGMATFISSISASMFIAGMRWGQVTGDIRAISDRLAKIEGMFTLQLRQDGHDGN